MISLAYLNKQAKLRKVISKMLNELNIRINCLVYCFTSFKFYDK